MLNYAAEQVWTPLSESLLDWDDAFHDLMLNDRLRMAALSQRFEPINQISYEVQLPQRADVLVSEIIGNMADNEDFQPILADAFRRFLKPGGKMLPRSTHASLVGPAEFIRAQQVT